MWSNVCNIRYLKLITAMPKVSKKNVIKVKCDVNFNRYAVVDDIFYVKLLQILNCFAVKNLSEDEVELSRNLISCRAAPN